MKSGPCNRRLCHTQRIVRTRQFSETYAQQRKFTGRFLVLWLYSCEGAALRLGVVASRKVGNAVARARAKRRAREAYRLNRHQFRGQVDVVIVTRHALLSAPWDAVVTELLKLARMAGLLGPEEKICESSSRKSQLPQSAATSGCSPLCGDPAAGSTPPVRTMPSTPSGNTEFCPAPD